MRGKDPIRILESIYLFDKDDQAWLTGIVDALEPYSWAEGLAAYTSTLESKIGVVAAVNRTRLPTLTLHVFAKTIPAALYRRLHAPMPLRHSHDVFPEAAAEASIPTLTNRWPVLPMVTPPAAWAVCGGDVNLKTTLVTLHCKREDVPSDYDHRILDQLGAHIGSALRLRTLLGRPPAPEEGPVDAVFDPEGRVLDARAELRETSAQEPLIDAVRRSEKAKLRRASADERLEMWTALIEGKWSVLESIERDGKRLLLAYRNDPRARPLRELTKREHLVAQYAALGHSLKYIAYELGVSIATAAADLDLATRKLGVTGRAGLIQLFARNATASKS